MTDDPSVADGRASGGESPVEEPAGLGPAHLPPERYWTERLEQDSSLGGVGYRGLGRPFNEWAYRARRSGLVNCLRTHDLRVAGIDILEVGAGTGFFVEFWTSQGARRITGLDITRLAVEHLSRRFPAQRFLQQDISAADCPTFGAFDIVTVFDVLFHVLDDRAFDRALTNICRQLKRGGHLLVTDILSESITLRGQTQLSRPLSVYRDRLEASGIRVIGLHPVLFTTSRAPDVSTSWARVVSRAYWNVLSAILEKAPAAGHLLGPACFLSDFMLQRLLKRGPSVKLLVGRCDS